MAKPTPPINPITRRINGGLIDWFLNRFFVIFLPNYEKVITSGYRDTEVNRAADGTEDSAHLYNLGRDFSLKNLATGQLLTDDQARKVFDEFIKPNWKGYAKFYPSSGGKSHHIHVHIDREISQATMWGGAAGALVGSIYLFRAFKKRFTTTKENGNENHNTE